jgi:hypothetical protein
MTSFPVTCTECGLTRNATPEHIGRTVTCECGVRFEVSRPESTVSRELARRSATRAVSPWKPVRMAIAVVLGAISAWKLVGLTGRLDHISAVKPSATRSVTSESEPVTLPKQASVPDEDEALEGVREWLRQNSHAGEWEEVQWDPPVALGRLAQRAMINQARPLLAEATASLAQIQELAGTTIDATGTTRNVLENAQLKASELQERWSVIESHFSNSKPRLVCRLKYRVPFALTGKRLVTEVFEKSDWTNKWEPLPASEADIHAECLQVFDGGSDPNPDAETDRWIQKTAIEFSSTIRKQQTLTARILASMDAFIRKQEADVAMVEKADAGIAIEPEVPAPPHREPVKAGASLIDAHPEQEQKPSAEIPVLPEDSEFFLIYEFFDPVANQARYVASPDARSGRYEFSGVLGVGMKAPGTGLHPLLERDRRSSLGTRYDYTFASESSDALIVGWIWKARSANRLSVIGVATPNRDHMRFFTDRNQARSYELLLQATYGTEVVKQGGVFFVLPFDGEAVPAE